MPEPATGSRLLELRAIERAARLGLELLEKKREVLLRETLRRRARLAAAREQARSALGVARLSMARARITLGRHALGTALLAHPPDCRLVVRWARLLGVRLPSITAHPSVFRPRYAPGGTTPALDEAGRAFSDAWPKVLQLAAEEAAARTLGRALAKTTRQVNALERRVLPELADAIRQVTSALDDEERDGALRVRQWAVRTGSRRTDGPARASR